jgi:D-alanyl-D-alanine carboxypeptidase
VTLRQLLAHTAGIFNEGSEGDPLADVGAIADPTLRSEGQAAIAAAMGDQGAVVPAEVTVAAAETHDRVNAPGGGYHYSNAGYQAAALYLEAETGRPLADLLRDVVTGPLGLERTTLAPADRTPPQLRGYETETVTGNRVDAAEDLRAFGNGANGGALTTADDLASFFRALVRGELVGPDLVQEMQLPTAVATRAGSAYGLGLASYELSCGRFYGVDRHGGRHGGARRGGRAEPAGPRRPPPPPAGRLPPLPVLTRAGAMQAVRGVQGRCVSSRRWRSARAPGRPRGRRRTRCRR